VAILDPNGTITWNSLGASSCTLRREKPDGTVENAWASVTSLANWYLTAPALAALSQTVTSSAAGTSFSDVPSVSGIRWSG
jgi:hypothetical protein